MHLSKTILSCLAVSAMLLLTSCDLPSREAERVEFLDGSFAVLKPAGWSMLKGLSDEAEVQMGNLFQEAYAIILTDHKVDLEPTTLADFSELTRSFIKADVENPEESDPVRLKIGEIPAVRYQISGRVDGVNIVYWHVSLETRDHYHQLVLWSLPSKFDGNKEKFKSVIQSFRPMGAS